MKIFSIKELEEETMILKQIDESGVTTEKLKVYVKKEPGLLIVPLLSDNFSGGMKAMSSRILNNLFIAYSTFHKTYYTNLIRSMFYIGLKTNNDGDSSKLVEVVSMFNRTLSKYSGESIDKILNFFDEDFDHIIRSNINNVTSKTLHDIKGPLKQFVIDKHKPYQIEGLVFTLFEILETVDMETINHIIIEMFAIMYVTIGLKTLFKVNRDTRVIIAESINMFNRVQFLFKKGVAI